MQERVQCPENFKPVVLGSVGTVLEYYDFAIFGYFAPILAKLFFPEEDYLASLISTFGVFSVGFLMRPLGALMFGHVGDKFGIRIALIYSVILMALATILIGFVPTYATAGLLAPVLLTVCRLLQGLSAGGEFTGSISFVVECAPEGKRGF